MQGVVTYAVENKLNLLVDAGSSTNGYSREAMAKGAFQLAGWALVLAFFITPLPLVAKRAPDPTLKALDGQTRKLSALHGQVVVLNFWATWRAPCQEELPRLSQMAAAYAGKPVKFALVSIDESRYRAKIPALLATLHVTLESWAGADTGTLDQFGLGNIVPGTVVLDEQGEIVARVMGEAREDDIRQAVDWLLAGKTGPAPTALTKRY